MYYSRFDEYIRSFLSLFNRIPLRHDLYKHEKEKTIIPPFSVRTWSVIHKSRLKYAYLNRPLVQNILIFNTVLRFSRIVSRIDIN